MPKIAISSQGMGVELQKNFVAIGNLLNGSMSVDNLQGDYFLGTTASVPDTAGQVKHSLKPGPIAIIPVVGDVYAYELTDSYIDIRSRLASQPYTVFVITGKTGRV